MGKFSHTIGLINIGGRIAQELVINFGNIQAAIFFIDHITQYGGQLNLNISAECVSNPVCAQNVIPYAVSILITSGIIRVPEQIVWRRITKGKGGEIRCDGKYQW